MAHNGRGGHVVRIYDERLFRLLDQHATAQHAFVGEIVAEALIEYFATRQESDPGFVVATIRAHPDAGRRQAPWKRPTPKHAKCRMAKVATAKRVPTPPPPEKIDCGF